MASVFPGALGWHAEVRYTDQISRCTYVRSKSRESLDIVFSLGFVLPCLVVMVCYGLIIYKSKQSQNKVNSYKTSMSHEHNASLFEQFLVKSDHYFRFIHKHHIGHRSHSYECLPTNLNNQSVPLIQLNNQAYELETLNETKKLRFINHELNHSFNCTRILDSDERKVNSIQPVLFDVFMLINNTLKKSQSELSNCQGEINVTTEEDAEANIKLEAHNKPFFYLDDNKNYNGEQVDASEYSMNLHINGIKDTTKSLATCNNKEAKPHYLRLIKSFVRQKSNEAVSRDIKVSRSCPEFGFSKSACKMKNDLFMLRNNKLADHLNTATMEKLERAAPVCGKCQKIKSIIGGKSIGNLPMQANGECSLKQSKQLRSDDLKAGNNKSKLFNKKNSLLSMATSDVELPQTKSTRTNHRKIKKNIMYKQKNSQIVKLGKIKSIAVTASETDSCKQENDQKTKVSIKTNRKFLSPNDCRRQNIYESNNISHFKSASSSGCGSDTTLKKPLHKTKRRNSMKMILVIFMAFALTYLPFTVVNLADDRAKLSRNWYMVTSLAFWAGSCTNPIIYGVLNDHFRKSYLDMLHLLASLFHRQTPNKSGFK